MIWMADGLQLQTVWSCTFYIFKPENTHKYQTHMIDILLMSFQLILVHPFQNKKSAADYYDSLISAEYKSGIVLHRSFV